MKNKRSKFYIIAGAIIVFILAGLLFARPYISSFFFDDYYKADAPVVAIFDRNQQAPPINAQAIEHFNVVWKSTAKWANTRQLETAISDHDVLITIETWLKGTAYKNNILTAITGGGFDEKIHDLALIAAKSNHQVFIRWAPDMEMPANVYPWQYQSPQAYIQTFNYFAKKIKQYAPKAKIVWGPYGYPGDTEYWPGNKYVDFVSITLGSVSEDSNNSNAFGKTIPQLLKSKLHRLRFINKPVLILGSSNYTQVGFNQKWLKEQAIFMNKFSNTIYSKSNYVDSSKIKPERKMLEIGAFDPNKKLLDQKHITVEHIFTDIGGVQRGDFERDLHEITNRHHDAIVTIEPWRDTTGKTNVNALQHILNGGYDAEIRKLFKIISSTKQIVYLRWMHEMEIPIHRYAWQSQDPVTYINAFRYFMLFEGGPAKNVKKIWGPAGDRGSIDFWPGDDVVDYISVAIYGLPDKNITDPTKQEAFSTIFNRKYYRMRFSDKPIFIAEFGVKGPEGYQDMWLGDAAKTIRSNPSIFGICYFNLYDNPKAWGHIKAPDWSITPRSMNKFASLLK